MIDFYYAALMSVFQIPALAVGFVAGVLYMRDNYLSVIRKLRIVIERQQQILNHL